MNKRGFHRRLAAQSIRQNSRFYLPFYLTGIASCAMFYIMCHLYQDPGVDQMNGADYVRLLLFLGAIVVAIFSTAVLFYANSFLMRRRRRELGLYSVLGLDRGHISRLLGWETLYAALISLSGGLLVGVLLSKLLLLLLCRILRYGVPFGFRLSWSGMGWTALVYGAVFLLCLGVNLWRVSRSQPLDLLASTKSAEREPQSKRFLALVGLITLAAGYGLAQTVRDPFSALVFFFVAVLLVIIGTYCLFIAGSIVFLKWLRKRKAFYYQARHFISISSLLHRMKGNAAGLASICILSTMVLVTVSTTICLYMGTEEVLYMLCPRDVEVKMSGSDPENMVALAAACEEAAERADASISDLGWVCYYPGPGDLGSTQMIGDKLAAYEEGTILNAAGQDYLPYVYVGFNVEGEVTEELLAVLWDVLNSGGFSYESAHVEPCETQRGELYSLLGGFFFLGILLGLLFLLATALIIYYKQLSEGYEDVERFRVMNQVGLSRDEARQGVRSQALTFFFLPLAASAVHLAFAFKMITYILRAFSLTNVALFALCCLGSLLVFALVYAAIYALATRNYYHIVQA